MSKEPTPQIRARTLFKQADKLPLNSDNRLNLLLEAFALDPRNLDVNLALFDHYYDQQNYDRTEDHLLRALPYTDDRPFIFEKLAFLYLSTEQLSKAKDSAIKGLEEEPDCIELQSLLTDIYLKLKDYESAVASAWRENELSDQEYEPIAIVSMAKAQKRLTRSAGPMKPQSPSTMLLPNKDPRTHPTMSLTIFLHPSSLDAETPEEHTG